MKILKESLDKLTSDTVAISTTTMRLLVSVEYPHKGLYVTIYETLTKAEEIRKELGLKAITSEKEREELFADALRNAEKFEKEEIANNKRKAIDVIRRTPHGNA